jgi:hypothetical protein
MLKKLSIVFLPSMLAIMPPLFGADEFKQPKAANTERFDFAPGGTIRIDGSYGSLTVEGWDQPAVEITVTKSLRFGGSKNQDQDQPRLESIKVVTSRTSPTELTISTMLASRNGHWSLLLPSTTTNGVRTEYEIHVPRDSRLQIHHGTGMVTVSGVTGDIEASAGRGDIMLWLRPGSYSIDARTKLGNVSSDFAGASLSQYLTGQRFTRVDPPPSHRLHLRMGFGGITIKEIYPESEAPVVANGK